jgi:DNA adenine methylase
MKQLRQHFPENISTLIEPFCGGGSVFLNTAANGYLSNDKNSYMIDLHNFLLSFKNKKTEFYAEIKRLITEYGLSASYYGITVPDELKQKHKKTYYAVFNKEAYSKLRNDFNKNQKDMIRLYLLLIYGFNHMLRFNGSGKFNLPVGNVDFNQNVYNALEDYFNFIENNTIQFANNDFEEFLENIDYKKNYFVYLDPPYLISDCEYNKGWTDEHETRLLRIIDKLHKKGVLFALSNVFTHKGRQNLNLIKWAERYNVQDVQSNYISYHDNTIKNTHEVLITNYKVAGV